MSPGSVTTSGGRRAVILAAGKGTRMRSTRPKVLHRVGGRPMLERVIETARLAGCEQISVVVGSGAREIQRGFGNQSDLVWVHQQKQRGTGHALAQAALDPAGTVIVLSGDAPLVRPQTIERLFRTAEEGWGAIGVARVAEPGSLGRVISDANGALLKIVEAADVNEEQRQIDLVNSGHYALRCPDIARFLDQLQPDNPKGELYLTDAVVAAAVAGHPVRCVELEDPSEAWGVNDRIDLSRVEARLNRLQLERLMVGGVTVIEPQRVLVEETVQVGQDAMIYPDVTLLGTTQIGAGAVLHSGSWIKDSKLGEGVEVFPHSVIEGARIGPGCQIGPFARIRPDSTLEREVRVGNFVEVKKSHLADGVKASHHAYLGDASIGAETNVGAGTITCNYDGRSKNRTEVGEKVFLGSDTMLVAPVKVGDRASTGAGSVITQDVPADALAVGRARQRNIENWAKRRR